MVVYFKSFVEENCVKVEINIKLNHVLAGKLQSRSIQVK